MGETKNELIATFDARRCDRQSTEAVATENVGARVIDDQLGPELVDVDNGLQVARLEEIKVNNQKKVKTNEKLTIREVSSTPGRQHLGANEPRDRSLPWLANPVDISVD